jgi:hypothetical protein
MLSDGLLEYVQTLVLRDVHELKWWPVMMELMTIRRPLCMFFDARGVEVIGWEDLSHEQVRAGGSLCSCDQPWCGEGIQWHDLLNN